MPSRKKKIARSGAKSTSDSDTPLPNIKDVERGALFFRSYANQMAVVPSILSNPKRREAAMRVARLTVGRHERAIARNTKHKATLVPKIGLPKTVDAVHCNLGLSSNVRRINKNK